MVELARILSEGSNQMAVIALFLTIMLGAIVQTLLKLLRSFWDYKALKFQNGDFAERRNRVKRNGKKTHSN